MNLVLLVLYCIMFWVFGVVMGIGGSLFGLFIPGLRDRISGYFERAAATTLYRPAITFGESSDLLLKRRDYDADQGAEVISSGDDQLETANPDDAIWSWHGTPLSITDEFFGINIDQRHIHPGEVLRDHIREGTLWVGDFWDWLNGSGKLASPAVAAVDEDAEPGTLQAARALFWGGEEADHPDTVKTFVAKAHEGRNDTAVWKQLLVPAAFLIVGFGLMFLGAKYGPSGGGGGSSQPAEPVGSTLALLLFGVSIRERARELWQKYASRLRGEEGEDEPLTRPRDEEHGDADAVIEMDEPDSPRRGGSGDDDGTDPLEKLKEVLPTTRQFLKGFGAVAGVLAIGVLLLFFHAFFGPLGLFAVLVSFLSGFALFPFSGPILSKRLPASFAERLAGVYLRFGLLPYQHPNLELSASGQEFVEGDGSGQRYRLAGKHIGLTINGEDVDELYGDRAESRADVADLQSTVTDVEDVPEGYCETKGLTFDNVKGYVPEQLSRDEIYVRLDRILAPFQQGNNGTRSKKALENAKEEYGAGWRELNVKQILWASLGAAVFGMLAGYLVFFGVPL